MKLNTQKVALTAGVFVGGWHVVWSVLIVLGLAQPLLDFVFWMHMLTVPYRVTGFTVTQSVTLIVVTFFVGYVGGWIFSGVWNYLHKK